VRYLDISPETRLHFPNAFTPNDDSVNDVFLPKGYLKGYKQYTLRIWNRWGEVVFDADEPDAGWNGRHQNAGQPVPSGVYLYEMTLIGPRGEVDQRRGSLTLLR
jgi:gliding motility-associated-like protein